MELTISGGMDFSLDYILYKPSFNSLAAKSVPSKTFSHPGIAKTTLIGSMVGGAIGLLILLAILIFRKRIFRRFGSPGSPVSELKGA